MRTLREAGYPLGVCAVALHHAADDAAAALAWLREGGRRHVNMALPGKLGVSTPLAEAVKRSRDDRRAWPRRYSWNAWKDLQSCSWRAARAYTKS